MDNALHDTLSVTKRLKGAGMNEPQAEAVAEAIQGSIREATAHLATKADLAAVKSELKSDMKAMESRLETKISSLESRLVWRLSGMMLGVAGIAIAVLRLTSPGRVMGHPPIFRDSWAFPERL